MTRTDDPDTSPEAVIGMANAMTGLGHHSCAALLRQLAKERGVLDDENHRLYQRIEELEKERDEAIDVIMRLGQTVDGVKAWPIRFPDSVLRGVASRALGTEALRD